MIFFVFQYLHFLSFFPIYPDPDPDFPDRNRIFGQSGSGRIKKSPIRSRSRKIQQLLLFSVFSMDLSFKKDFFTILHFALLYYTLLNYLI